MKMRKLFFFIVVMLIPAFYASAQHKPVYADETDRDTSRTALRTTWESARPGDNWFVTVHAGIADLMSEESRYVKFGDRINFPTFGLSVGKWMSPVWGVRMNITGAKLQGFAVWEDGVGGLGNWYVGKNYTSPSGNPTNNYIPAWESANAKFIEDRFLNMDDRIDTKQGDGYSYDFKYAGVSFDFLLNLKNFCMKYNEKAFFNPILYGGIGFAHTFKDKDNQRTAVNSIMEKFGLMLDFRLSDAWSVNLDGQMMILPEFFDRRVGDGNTQDGLANYTVGITYRFNDRYFHKVNPANPAEIDALNRQINELRNRPVVVCPECPKACIDVDINGIVKDKNGNVLSDASVFVLNNNQQTVTVLRTDANGKYRTIVPCGASLVIKAVKSGYSDDCTTLTAPADKTGETIIKQVPDLSLEKYRVGQTFKIENIYYDFDKWNIRPDAAAELDKTVAFLKENPQLTVELGSHTDSRGSDSYNQRLSQRRAESAVKYIVDNGVDKKRITAKGYGETQLVNECKDGVKCTEEQHQANRRTELKITGVEESKTTIVNVWDKYSGGQVVSASEFRNGFFKCN